MSQEPPDADLERLLRSYFAQQGQRPSDFEQFWQKLDAALDATPAVGTETSLMIEVAQCAAPASNDAAPEAFDPADDEEYDFVLEDTLEESMTNSHDQREQPSTTERSTRWNANRRGLSPRATAIAGIAASLILAVIATTIYTQFAIRRTAHPAATATAGGAFTKIALPGDSTQSIDALITAPNGSLWYARSIGRSLKIGHVKPDESVTEFPVPVADNVRSILIHELVYGQDGNLLLSGENFDGSVYTPFLRRITSAGVVTEVSLPTDLIVGLMIAGPDGAIWFTAGKRVASVAGAEPSYTQLMGKMTSDGRISEYSIPSQEKGSGIVDICAGPDQAIWYTWISNINDTANLKGRIGRMSFTGQAQEFPVSYLPESIISGPDGALWYSERDPASPNAYGTAGFRKGFVGHITTAGIGSEVPTNPSASAGQIVTGSDGAVWYTVQEGDTGTFGRITPSGGVKTYTTPGGVQINTLAAGPGFLWMVDATNTLWRYQLPK